MVDDFGVPVTDLAVVNMVTYGHLLSVDNLVSYTTIVRIQLESIF